MKCRTPVVALCVLLVLSGARGLSGWTATLGLDTSPLPSHGVEGVAGALGFDPEDKSTPGQIGRALWLDGDDDYVQAPEHESLNIDDAITVAAWVKHSGGDGIIVNRGGGWSEPGYSLFLYGGNIRVELQNAVEKTISDNVFPADGEWHHVAFTWDSASEIIQTYLDGELQATTGTFSGPIGMPTQLLNIGRNEEHGYYFDGVIDEVAVFERALDAAGISTICGSGWDGMPGLVLGLHLDESPATHGTTLADASGHENHGTLSTSAIGPPYPGDKATPGKVGGALRFDGVDDYVQVPDHSTLNPGQELTVMAWVYLEDPGADQKIVGKTPIGSGYVLGLYDNQLYPEIWDSDGVRHVFWEGTIPAQTWTHLAVTWSSGGDMTGYVDGQQVGQITASDLPIGASDTPLIVGAAPWDARQWRVNGAIDEVAVFDRALGAAEISTIYGSGWEGMPGQALGLHLDESPAVHGTILADASGHENRGVLVAPPLELSYTDVFELEWQNDGSAYYRPVVPNGFHALGHYGQGDHGNPLGFSLVARELEPGLLARPDDYALLWSGSGGSFWAPVPPAGYACLGVVAQSGAAKPGLDEVRCIHQAVTAPGKEGKKIWTYPGANWPTTVGAWHVVPADEYGVLVGAFTARSSTASPAGGPYVLDRRWIKGADAGLGRADVAGLIQQYGPILYLHPEENYFLDDVEWVLDHGVRLEWALVFDELNYDTHQEQYRASISTSSATLMDDVNTVINSIKPNPPYNNSDAFKYWLHIADASKPGSLSRAQAQVRVLPWNQLFTEIQFWFFYPFNGPGRVEVCATGWWCDDNQLARAGRHYGDWEHVTLRFFNLRKQLVSVYMSAHSGGRWYGTGAFGGSLRFLGDHPMVYSAKYSHAHYPTTGYHEYERVFEYDYWWGTASGDLYDLTGSGYQFNSYSPDHYQVISSDANPVPEPDWLKFDRRWGQYERLEDPIYFEGIKVYTFKEVGAGPSGPAGRGTWQRGEIAGVFGWPPYRAPVAFPDAYSVDEDDTLAVAAPGVLANDVGENPLAVKLVRDVRHGALSLSGAGSFTYTPAGDFNGPDSFSYRADDGALASAVATVNLDVNPVNDPPRATDDTAETLEDTPRTIAVLGNDSDPESDPLTVTAVGTPGNGTTGTDGATVTYTPTLNFSGPDVFTYTISDPGGLSDWATVTVTVGAANDAPVARDDHVDTPEDTARTIAVLDNDSDPEGDTLVMERVGAPVKGTAAIVGTVVAYTPTLNFYGSVTFTYTVSDGDLRDTATVEVTVISVNDPPTISDLPDQTTTVNTLVGPLAFAIGDVETPASQLDLAAASSDTILVPLANILLYGSGGERFLTITPSADLTGTAVITLTVSDGLDATSDALKLTVSEEVRHDIYLPLVLK